MLKKKTMTVLIGSVQTLPNTPGALPGEQVELSIEEADALAAAGVVGDGDAAAKVSADNAAVTASQGDLEAARADAQSARRETDDAKSETDGVKAENADLKKQLASIQAKLDASPSKGDDDKDVGDTSGDNTPLTGDELTAAISDVCASDKLVAPDDFTGDGVPKTKSLERELGYGITAGERDVGWDAYKAKQA